MRIRLLGGLEVTSPDHRQVRFATRKTALVFAALVLGGQRGYRRERLCEAFWPGRGVEQARNSLRQSLVDIRRLFPADGGVPHIEGDQETVALIVGPDDADISVFDRKIEADRTTDLASAAEIYRGELLAGEAISDGLDEWFGPYRSRYLRKALQLVERLSLTLTGSESAEAIACEALAERLLASEPTEESAHRALMRIHAGRGHQNSALRQFEVCRALLKKHLGAEPEVATSSLAATLQSQECSDRNGIASGLEIVSEPQRVAVLSSHGDRPSVAVLPFQNFSGDAEQDYFADGIVEEITIALTQFRHLDVIARNSSFTYKGQAVDIKKVGRELNVRYVVEGSVRRTGEQLRITGQLIDTATGAHLWADRFDGTLANVFDLQDQVASSIVGAVTPKVEEAEIERSKRKTTESLDAYDYYLRGLAAFDRTITNRAVIDEALRLFKRAIECDHGFAIAYARAARCYATKKSHGWMANAVDETAEASSLARRAVELGWDDAVALTYGGYVLGYVGGDLDQCSACIDRALFLNPNLAAALGVSSWVKACLGEPDKAVEDAALAMRLSPLDPRLFAWQFNTGLAHFCAGRYGDAAAWAGRSLRHQPNYPSAIRVLAAGHVMSGRRAEAHEAMARLRRLDPALRLSNLAAVLPPFRRPDDLERYVEALRMAGLPE
ncbi:adenylate cyclase [Rhizobium sp. 3T7]|uniref:BTAD domain-containing putative transcriptional regulator n=1 Tax=Rhizobium sp. 3T7 TaxID=2874922 RepID=UPI001CCF26C0|nr:BTAD domain-containing putative transcriptional regulator [Rhizobium sp. 3T7]MBZ9792914.1 adenylate cyclase [Rhizobium sp. 3T7]